MLKYSTFHLFSQVSLATCHVVQTNWMKIGSDGTKQWMRTPTLLLKKPKVFIFLITAKTSFKVEIYCEFVGGHCRFYTQSNKKIILYL
jgi:hypothetical protein